MVTLGELDERTSQTVIETFLRLLAGQDTGGSHQ